MSKVDVSLIIPTFNEEDNIRETIIEWEKALANFNYEILVIDNGSIDGTVDYLNGTFPSIEVLRLEKNAGYSGGFNYGIDYAIKKLNADYILISNNDVKIGNTSIKALVSTAETDSKIGFVTGKVYFYEWKH